jgi:hypothetical protein
MTKILTSFVVDGASPLITGKTRRTILNGSALKEKKYRRTESYVDQDCLRHIPTPKECGFHDSVQPRLN